MNVMLAAGGYPWTVIPVDERNAYMAALEAASALFRGISNTFDSPFARRFSTATLHTIIQA